MPFPSDLHIPPSEVIDLYVLAFQFLRQFIAIQDDLLSVIRQGELFTDMTLFAVAQDVSQAIRLTLR